MWEAQSLAQSRPIMQSGIYVRRLLAGAPQARNSAKDFEVQRTVFATKGNQDYAVFWGLRNVVRLDTQLLVREKVPEVVGSDIDFIFHSINKANQWSL